jgi:hypothetical protein
MRLTAKDNPETIRRYGHIRPASGWGVLRCSVRLPGTSRACTLEDGHTGPHVTHGAFKRVVAVWEGEGRAAEPRKPDAKVLKAHEPDAKVRKARAAVARTGFGDRGPIATVRAFWRRLVRRPEHVMEELVFLVFTLAMVGFVIDWTLRLLGLR